MIWFYYCKDFLLLGTSPKIESWSIEEDVDEEHTDGFIHTVLARELS